MSTWTELKNQILIKNDGYYHIRIHKSKNIRKQRINIKGPFSNNSEKNKKNFEKLTSCDDTINNHNRSGPSTTDIILQLFTYKNKQKITQEIHLLARQYWD